MIRAVAWLKASRPAAQSYIALPLLLGQALWVQSGGAFSWAVLLLVQLFGLFDQLFIVYANDYADRDTDRLNQTATPFSGGSRVLVDGDLPPGALRAASRGMAVLCLGVGLVLALFFARPWAVPLGALALGLLWAYSYPPFSVSYRGGGELLQMLGVGGVLPLFGWYAQAGTVGGFPWEVLAILLPTHLACGIATALPDEPSDRLSGKHSAAVLLGPLGARLAIVALNLGSLLAFVSSPWWPAAPLGGALLVAVPGAATLGQLALVNSVPGSRQILVQVFLAILVTLSLVTALGLARWVA